MIGKGQAAWIPMSGSAARLLLSTLAPWEPMCRRFQETNGGPGQWLQEWGHYHRFRKGKEPSRDEYMALPQNPGTIGTLK
jgi:hypothetical protein